MMSTIRSNNKNVTLMNQSTTFSVDDIDLDSLWLTPFDVVWYGVLLVVLYSLVFTACVVGQSVRLSVSPSPHISLWLRRVAP